jgi:uncharacterized membrane protein YvbJ
MPEEKQIVPRPDNVYCPVCGEIGREGDKYCRKCGASLANEKSKKETKTPEDSETKKKRRKKKIVTLVVVFIVLLLAGGAFAYTYYSRLNKTNKDYENKVNVAWSEILDKSNKFKDDLKNVNEERDMTSLSDETIDLERLLKNKSSEVDGMDTPKGYENSKNDFKTACQKYSDYLSKLRNDILKKNIANINVNRDFGEVQKYADYTSDALDNFYKSSSFIKDHLSEDIFDLSKLKEFVLKTKGQEQSEAEKKAQEEAEAKKAAEKQAAEKTTTDFMSSLPNAYGATDKWAEAQRIADKYWYTPSINNFRSDYQFYFEGDPGTTYLGGQVITGERVSDTKFNISTEEREKFTGPGGSSENRYLTYFIVEKIGTSGWFITSHGRR